MKRLDGTAATVCLIGLGNIGSHLAELVARMSGLVRKIVLVDADFYAPSNLSGQAITSAGVGQSKVAVTASRLRLIDPDLEIAELPQRVENLPRGALRSDVIVAGLDSKRSRMFVSELSTRLGIIWIDAAVEASQLLARVSVFAPGQEMACMECGFGGEDYAAIDQTLPCVEYGESRGAHEPPATGAPAFLGSLAASLAAAELAKLLAGNTVATLIGRELVLSASGHTHFVTTLRRNRACRFSHNVWQITELAARPTELSVADLFRLGDKELAAGRLSLSVEPQRFVTRLVCPDCQESRDTLMLSGRLGRARCDCGGTLEAIAFHTLGRVAATDLPAPLLRRSLADIGILPNDVVSLVGEEDELHFELVGAADDR